jgi:dGTPase
MLSNKICPNAGTILKYTFYDRYIKDTIGENSWTVEALVVAIADEIAQRHHDVEDGLIAKIINKEMLSERIREYFKDVLTDNNIMLLDLICCENDDTVIHSAYSKLIVDIMVNDVIEGTRTKINKMCCKYSIKTNVDFNVYKGYIPVDEVLGLVCFSEIFKSGEGKLHNFLKDKILKSHIVQVMDGKATYIIRQLFKAYITNPQQLPDDVIVKFFEEMLPGLNRKGLLSTTDISRLRENLEYNFRTNSRKKYRQYLSRAICDYIASMTDNMAYQQYEILYGATKVPL